MQCDSAPKGSVRSAMPYLCKSLSDCGKYSGQGGKTIPLGGPSNAHTDNQGCAPQDSVSIQGTLLGNSFSTLPLRFSTVAFTLLKRALEYWEYVTICEAASLACTIDRVAILSLQSSLSSTEVVFCPPWLDSIPQALTPPGQVTGLGMDSGQWTVVSWPPTHLLSQTILHLLYQEAYWFFPELD